MRMCLVAIFLVCVGVQFASAETNAAAKDIAAAIEDQFASLREPTRSSSVYAKDAMVAMTGGASSPQVTKLNAVNAKWTIFGPGKVGTHKLRDVRIVVARDGNSAWASFVAKIKVDGLAKSGTVDYRATELFARTAAGWQVKAAVWSQGVAAPALAKAAKAGNVPDLEPVFEQDLGDRDVREAVKTLVAAGLDATASARADVVGIGPLAGDVAIGGKKLAAKLTKEWLGKLALEGTTWGLTVGTTACATVNARLTRGAATIPARLFVVLEKDTGGAWSAVLVHLATALP